jgi:hypothetical protein
MIFPLRILPGLCGGFPGRPWIVEGFPRPSVGNTARVAGPGGCPFVRHRYWFIGFVGFSQGERERIRVSGWHGDLPTSPPGPRNAPPVSAGPGGNQTPLVGRSLQFQSAPGGKQHPGGRGLDSGMP